MFLGLDIISNITDWIYANWTVVLTVIRTIIDGAPCLEVCTMKV